MLGWSHEMESILHTTFLIYGYMNDCHSAKCYADFNQVQN
jgi:hypothetical protein